MNLIINDAAIRAASGEMKDLKEENDALMNEIQEMYENVRNALNTPAGKEIKFYSEESVLTPLRRMSTIIGFVSDLLVKICDTEFYGTIFTEYEDLIKTFIRK